MQLRVMSTAKLLEGDATAVSHLELGTAIPEGFVFSQDGRYLYGSSYYTGVSNIYRVAVATGELEALSNAEPAIFRPLPLDERTLLVFRYSAAGFVPATIPIQPTEDLSAITFLGERIATQQPIVQQWNTSSPSAVDFATVASRPAEYSAVRELGVESLYPGHRRLQGFGVVRPACALQRPGRVRYAGRDTPATVRTTTCHPRNGCTQPIEYRHSLWKFGAKWNGADFYDLFGPTKRSREGYSAYVGYERPLIYSPPEEMSLKVDAAYYGDLDSLPAFQNIPSPSDRLFTANIGLEYEYPRASIGWVDDETGHLWGLYTHAYVADSDVIPSSYGKLRLGFALPLRSLVDLAQKRGRRELGRSRQPARQLRTSVASATTTSTTAKPSAIARSSRCRVSRSTH